MSTKIMHGVDIAPRVSLVLILPSGITLMAWGPLGDDFFVHGWLLALVWVAGAGLAGGVADRLPRRQHPDRAVLAEGRPAGALLAVAPGWSASAIYTMVATDPFGVDTNPKWLGAKVVGVRALHLLRRDDPAAAAAVRAGVRQAGHLRLDPEVEKAILGSIRRCEPWVYAIWTLVLVAAFLGVVKPGSTAF